MISSRRSQQEAGRGRAGGKTAITRRGGVRIGRQPVGLTGMMRRRVWYCRGGLIVLGATRIGTHVVGLVEARRRRVWQLRRGVDQVEERGDKTGEGVKGQQ